MKGVSAIFVAASCVSTVVPNNNWISSIILPNDVMQYRPFRATNKRISRRAMYDLKQSIKREQKQQDQGNSRLPNQPRSEEELRRGKFESHKLE